MSHFEFPKQPVGLLQLDHFPFWPTWLLKKKVVWELDSAGAIIRVVAGDNSSLAGCSGEDTSITNVIFNVTDLGTFGSRAQGQNVVGNEGGFLTTAMRAVSNFLAV